MMFGGLELIGQHGGVDLIGNGDAEIFSLGDENETRCRRTRHAHEETVGLTAK